jgi:glycerol-3-phosphate dehydrogenase
MNLRENNINKLPQQDFDVLIVGGGINGAVSASALAAKGVKVALIDRGDFACMTSSNSSNLAWGGIKYLETGELLLVNKLCKSRNHLLKHYPSRVKEIRFFTTIQKGFRMPVWMVYLGTLLYWAMGRFYTQPPIYRTVKQVAAAEPVVNTSNIAGGFEYSDCYLHDNDSRFVFNFIRDSLNHGCIAANYVELLDTQRRDGRWHSTVKDVMTDKQFAVRARILINACGPYVDLVNQQSAQLTEHRHLFSKGVHLIVDRVTEHRKVLTFFASDGRLFFVLPMGPRTCIGTTDTAVDTPVTRVSDADRQFLLDNANALLNLPRPLQHSDIIAERCGVRPLVVSGDDQQADWVQLSRKHVVECDNDKQHISIFGGKLTDCLNVGEEITERVAAMGITVPYPKQRWYGEPEASVREAFFHQASLMDLDSLTSPGASEPLSQRLWRRYAAFAFLLLDRIREDTSKAELLIDNAEYLRCEIELAARREMITKLEDFMRRRSKIELVVKNQAILDAPGLRDTCQILFGEHAEQRLQEYIDDLQGKRTNPTS